MEGHAVTTRRADRLVASPHPIQTVPGAISQRAMIVDHVVTAALATTAAPVVMVTAALVHRAAIPRQVTAAVRPAATSAILGHSVREIATRVHPVPATVTHDRLARATAMVVPSAPAIAPIGETGRHARSVPMARGAPSAAAVPTADPIAVVAPTRSVSGPRAVRPRAGTATPVSVSLKRIAIPSASARFVPSTRRRRSPRV